eukprot:gb/GECH01009087.1/.p1 GENE.gb/GECH01009087.1/~~gb/GECH01009087.1/.p1  ORF type:complete len:174 (+),score=31.94 gb/GECH01009087.1/:1-522(+)
MEQSTTSSSSSSYTYMPLFRGTSRRPSRLGRLLMSRKRIGNLNGGESSRVSLNNNDYKIQNNSSSNYSFQLRNEPIHQSSTKNSNVSQWRPKSQKSRKTSSSQNKENIELNSNRHTTNIKDQKSIQENDYLHTDKRPAKKPRLSYYYYNFGWQKDNFINYHSAMFQKSSHQED